LGSARGESRAPIHSVGRVGDGCYIRHVEAAVWTAIGLLAATSLGSLFYLGSRIDALGSRIDALGSRIDTLGARLDARIDAVNESISNRIDAVNESLSTRIDGLGAKLDRHLERHAG
jgi:hypothetical protein